MDVSFLDSNSLVQPFCLLVSQIFGTLQDLDGDMQMLVYEQHGPR